ncbi:ANTAR domain-containing protein [Streptomyces mirabilis]|uniref:ANTAR domain-containing protein n=1 Tax=Streptomyces mirabilis TaxID=68239 RepID=UPI00364A3301
MPTTVWPACDELVGSRAVSDVSERMERLEHENEQLRYAIESRPVIDLARGALMATFGCPAEDAWGILVEVSQNSNVKLRVVADVVTAAVTGPEPMPPDLQNHLRTAVERWRSREHEPGAGG